MERKEKQKEKKSKSESLKYVQVVNVVKAPSRQIPKTSKLFSKPTNQ